MAWGTELTKNFNFTRESASMDIHRYNKVTGFIDKTVNVNRDNAVNEFNQISGMIVTDPMFCKYYRITLFDKLSNRIIKDSDSFIPNRY